MCALGQGVGMQQWWHEAVGSSGGTCGRVAMNLGVLITTWCLKRCACCQHCLLSASGPHLHPSALLHLSSTSSPSTPSLGYDFVRLCFMLEASPPLMPLLSPSWPSSSWLALGVHHFSGCRRWSMLFFRLDLVLLVHLQTGVDADWPRFWCGNAGVGHNRNGIRHHSCSRHCGHHKQWQM